MKFAEGEITAVEAKPYLVQIEDTSYKQNIDSNQIGNARLVRSEESTIWNEHHRCNRALMWRSKLMEFQSNKHEAWTKYQSPSLSLDNRDSERLLSS